MLSPYKLRKNNLNIRSSPMKSHRAFFVLKQLIISNILISVMFRLLACFAFSLLAFVATSSIAGDNVSVDVSYANEIYSTKLSTTLNAKPDAIYRLLTSYDELNLFSRLIQKSKLLPNGHLQLHLKVCFIFICFDKQQTLKLTISKRSITGEIIPEYSDFTYGWLKWTLTNHNNATLINFDSEITPNFWIPPFIGTLLIQYKLKNEAEYSVLQLEKLANNRQ